MKCPECKSKRSLGHTDKELRQQRILYWQCHNCDHRWESNFAEYNKAGKYNLVVNHLENEETELICPQCNIELAAEENPPAKQFYT